MKDFILFYLSAKKNTSFEIVLIFLIKSILEF